MARTLGVATWTVVTIGLLFGLQAWQASFNALRYGVLPPAQTGDRDALYAAQREALDRGPVKIAQAMEMVARDRARLPGIRPEPSSDPAPAAGWRHHPRYVEPPVDEGLPPPPPPAVDGLGLVDPALGAGTAFEDTAAAPAPAPRAAAAGAPTTPAAAPGGP